MAFLTYSFTKLWKYHIRDTYTPLQLFRGSHTEEDRRVRKEAECKAEQVIGWEENERAYTESAEAALWSLLGLTTPHCRHFNNCSLCYNNTGLPCRGRFQFLHQCPSCTGQTKGPAWLNRRQSQIALSVASLAVNEAIFLAALRGN